MRLLVVLLALSSVAASAERTALMPVSAPDARLAGAVESALVEAARHVDVVTLVNVDGSKPRGPRVDVKADPHPRERVVALAKEQSAALVVLAEPQPLGDGVVVYLEAVEASGKVRGSTTVVLPHDPTVYERALRGGLVQLLAPARYTGTLSLDVDVRGAQVEIDGHMAELVSTLSVGPHAIRVTHPAYHDFLRFIDIEFDRTRTESVRLAAFPLAEGEMADRRKRGGPGGTYKVPWYRSWWALGVTGAVICGATIGIVYGARSGIAFDHSAHYTGVPTP